MGTSSSAFRKPHKDKQILHDTNGIEKTKGDKLSHHTCKNVKGKNKTSLQCSETSLKRLCITQWWCAMRIPLLYTIMACNEDSLPLSTHISKKIDNLKIGEKKQEHSNKAGTNSLNEWCPLTRGFTVICYN